MPYKFGEYVSTYVDPQSVKISETLRERFLSNFQANDQLTMAVEQMQAASAFENDVNRKKELQRRTENALAQLAERGDFENLGFQIHRTAKQFAKEYAPIEENYKRYQGALQEVAKAYEKGDINADYAQLYKSYMTRGYKGFELDPETGRVKEGSMFTAPGIIKDPKVFDRIKKAIEIINPEEYSQKISDISKGPDGMYKISTESGVKTITDKKVQAAIDMVMEEPDVKAYVNQMSDMQAYNLYAQGRLPEVMQSQADRLTQNIDMLSKAVQSGNLNTATKKVYTENIARLRSELETINSASQSDEQAYTYIKQRLAKDMFRPVEDFVMEAVPYRNVSSANMVDYDQKWLTDYKAQKDWELANPEMTGYTNVTADVRDGATVEEQRVSMTKNFEASMKAYEDAEQEGLAVEEKVRLQNEGKRLKQEALRIQQQINLAINKSVDIKQIEAIDPSIVNTIKEYYGITKSSEVLLTLQKVLYNPNDPANKGLQESFKSKYGITMSTYLGKTYGGVKTKEMLQDGILADPRGAYVAATEDGAASLWKKFNDIATRSDVSDKFKEIKTSTLVHYGALPGLTIEESKVATKAAKDFFTDYIIPADTEVKILTGDEAGGNTTGSDLAGYKVVKYGFAAEYGGNGGWELQLADSDGNTKTVMLDAKKVNNPQLQRYTSSPEMRFATTVDRYNTRNSGDEMSYELENTSSPDYNLIVTVRSQGDAPPLVKITDKNGKGYEVVEKNGQVVYETKKDAAGNTKVVPIFKEVDPKFKSLNNSTIQTLLKLDDGIKPIYNP